MRQQSLELAGFGPRQHAPLVQSHRQFLAEFPLLHHVPGRQPAWVWLRCSMAALGFAANAVAIPADLTGLALPVGIDGLAGLSFLSLFHRWGAEHVPSNEWHFVLETVDDARR